MAGAIKARSSGERILSDTRILGSGEFVQDILRQTEISEQQERTIRREWSKEMLQESIATISKISAASLRSNDRRRVVAEARSMLVYALTDWLGIIGDAVALLPF
jgi:chromosomal replication initiation ATPase DnaA